MKNLLDKNEVHQSILDVGYAEWQKQPTWSYSDMIDWVEKTYGRLPAVAILLGKYNQQVGNGGHIQYYDNGYATSDSNGCMVDYEGVIDLHERMVELFELENLVTLKHGSHILELMKSFHVDVDDERYAEETCSCCCGDGQVENEDYDEDDEDSEPYEDCSECDGSGWYEYENDRYGQPTNKDELDRYDTEYYTFHEEWMSELEAYLKQKYFSK